MRYLDNEAWATERYEPRPALHVRALVPHHSQPFLLRRARVAYPCGKAYVYLVIRVIF